MAKQNFITTGRIILTKPGFEAAPGVADENKIFDSDWDFTGTLLASGRYYDPNGAGRTTDSSPRVVNYPVPFTPRSIAVFIQEAPVGVNGYIAYAHIQARRTGTFDDGDDVFFQEWTASLGSISYPRRPLIIYNQSGQQTGTEYAGGDFMYRVLAL